MKTFKVLLQNGAAEIVHAVGYRREGEQYVFDRADSDEVQWFLASEVIGVIEILFGVETIPPAPRTPLF